MNSRRAALLALFALSALCAVGVRAQQTDVVTSIRPLALITRALAGDAFVVQSLPGVDAAPHDFVLRPSGMQALRAARLFVWMGPTLEHPLARVLSRDAEVPALAVLPALGVDAAADPHLWLDPRRAIDIAQVVAASLRERGLIDAAHETAALVRFTQAMQSRERAIAAEFAGVESAPFIVLHDGLRAIVARFGLQQVGALPASHDTQPGARSLAELRRAALQRHALCLFREPRDSADLARTLAEGTAMRIVVLDTLAQEAPDTAQGFDDYLQSIAHTMAQCLRAGSSPSPESP